MTDEEQDESREPAVFTMLAGQVVRRDYVCAQCYGHLVMDLLPDRLVSLYCPEHGDVGLCGRVTRWFAERELTRRKSDWFELKPVFGFQLEGVPTDEAQLLKQLGY